MLVYVHDTPARAASASRSSIIRTEEGLGADLETHCNSMLFDFPKLCAKYLMVLETPAPLGSATQYSSANPEWPHSGSPGPLFRVRLCYL